MSRSKFPTIVLAAVLAAGCSSGGYQYWLYPGPPLPEAEESTFVAHENHRVVSIDGEELFSSCTRRDARPQAYDRTDVVCRYHIRPGQHSVAFQANITSMGLMSLDFDAHPGSTYGLTWTGCGASLNMDLHRKTCRVNVEEIKGPEKVG